MGGFGSGCSDRFAGPDSRYKKGWRQSTMPILDDSVYRAKHIDPNAPLPKVASLAPPCEKPVIIPSNERFVGPDSIYIVPAGPAAGPGAYDVAAPKPAPTGPSFDKPGAERFVGPDSIYIVPAGPAAGPGAYDVAAPKPAPTGPSFDKPGAERFDGPDSIYAVPAGPAAGPGAYDVAAPKPAPTGPSFDKPGAERFVGPDSIYAVPAGPAAGPGAYDVAAPKPAPTGPSFDKPGAERFVGPDSIYAVPAGPAAGPGAYDVAAPKPAPTGPSFDKPGAERFVGPDSIYAVPAGPAAGPGAYDVAAPKPAPTGPSFDKPGAERFVGPDSIYAVPAGPAAGPGAYDVAAPKPAPTGPSFDKPGAERFVGPDSIYAVPAGPAAGPGAYDVAAPKPAPTGPSFDKPGAERFVGPDSIYAVPAGPAAGARGRTTSPPPSPRRPGRPSTSPGQSASSDPTRSTPYQLGPRGAGGVRRRRPKPAPTGPSFDKPGAERFVGPDSIYAVPAGPAAGPGAYDVRRPQARADRAVLRQARGRALRRAPIHLQEGAPGASMPLAAPAHRSASPRGPCRLAICPVHTAQPAARGSITTCACACRQGLRRSTIPTQQCSDLPVKPAIVKAPAGEPPPTMSASSQPHLQSLAYSYPRRLVQRGAALKAALNATMEFKYSRACIPKASRSRPTPRRARRVALVRRALERSSEDLCVPIVVSPARVSRAQVSSGRHLARQHFAPLLAELLVGWGSCGCGTLL